MQRVYIVQDIGKFRYILGYCNLRGPNGTTSDGTGVVYYRMNSIFRNIRDQMRRRNCMFTRNEIRNILFDGSWTIYEGKAPYDSLSSAIGKNCDPVYPCGGDRSRLISSDPCPPDKT